MKNEMKLAVCFTVFDGIELLDAAIMNMVPHADSIIICYQDISNRGHEAKLELSKALDNYRTTEGIHIIKYETNLATNPKENERRKHNLMVDTARQLGATHFLLAAVDHFYMDAEIEFAKDIIGKSNFDATFTQMYTYYKKPTWQLDPVETYSMPFICKLHPHTRIEKVPNFPVYVDPSVQMNTWHKFYEFRKFEIMLHHYSMCRKDIRSKFLNAASSWTEEKVNAFTEEWRLAEISFPTELKYFPDKKIREVDDYFKLSSIFDK